MDIDGFIDRHLRLSIFLVSCGLSLVVFLYGIIMLIASNEAEIRYP